MVLQLTNIITDEVTRSFIGVPLHTLATAVAGSLISFAYGKSESSRKRLFVLAAANTFVAVSVVVVVPSWLSWNWVTPSTEPPLAGLIAFICRWAIPAALQAAPSIIASKFGVTINLPNENENDKGS